jgi:hypothetical protein
MVFIVKHHILNENLDLKIILELKISRYLNVVN